jgi:hypothetical protein
MTPLEKAIVAAKSSRWADMGHLANIRLLEARVLDSMRTNRVTEFEFVRSGGSRPGKYVVAYDEAYFPHLAYWYGEKEDHQVLDLIEIEELLVFLVGKE